MPDEPKPATGKGFKPRSLDGGHDGPSDTTEELDITKPAQAIEEIFQTSLQEQWSSPVEFETNSPGIYRSVANTLEALHVLDGWWLKVDGPAFKQAINTCIDATRGDASNEDARAAFINALAEGGVITRAQS